MMLFEGCTPNGKIIPSGPLESVYPSQGLFESQYSYLSFLV